MSEIVIVLNGSAIQSQRGVRVFVSVSNAEPSNKDEASASIPKQRVKCGGHPWAVQKLVWAETRFGVQ